MLRLCDLLVAALLFAGAVLGSDVRNVTIATGEFFTATVITFTHERPDRCFFTDPALQTIDLLPEGDADSRFQLHPATNMTSCFARVNDVTVHDNGIWTLTSDFNGNLDSSSYNVTVTPKDAYETDDGVDITWLPRLNHVVRLQSNVTVSLSNIHQDEECYLISPDEEELSINDSIKGVTAHAGSDFISCRIVIGPIEDDTLLGIWSLCGKHTGETETVRCQPVSLAWNNNMPDSMWLSLTANEFHHPVHFGGILTPAVRGAGTVNTCHVVTPAGEDIIVHPTWPYPGLQRAALNDASICSIAIGPIDASMLGEWSIYGTFNSLSGFNEAHLPMTLYLYDEDNPYQQAYNVTTPDPVTRTVNLRSTVELEVAGTGSTDSCYFRTPSGQTYDQISALTLDDVSFVDVGNRAACKISIKSIAEETLGQWQLIGKFNSNNNLFTEIRQIFNVVLEDPLNPIVDEDRTVVNLTARFFSTSLGARHRVAINAADMFTTSESCHVRTPEGRQYTIMEGFQIAGIEVDESPNVACGISVNVVSEDIIGEWTLISRERRLSILIERRLPFTIYVEEKFSALPPRAIIAEGNDFHIRLMNETDLSATCRLMGPMNTDHFTIEIDQYVPASCGFIVRNITHEGTGLWEIVYGNRKVYRAVAEVSVTDRSVSVAGQENLVWTKDRPVVAELGPEDAVYCRLRDPTGLTVFDGFGRCNLTLERVTSVHAGIWSATVGTPGRVLTDEHLFIVTVTALETKPLVTTRVEHNKPIISLSCSLPSGGYVTACKFRDPSGRVLLATQGVGEDRYSFHRIYVDLESQATSNECNLRITNPLARDLGLWRCALETQEETAYGFLTVLCPWAMRDPEVAVNVVSEPVLTASQQVVSALEGDAVTMRCSVQSVIRYCYFRYQNGTTFNVGPGNSEGAVEYTGAGFDAGECYARFEGLRAGDSGRWSCHVGFPNASEPEQRALFNVTVDVSEGMVVEMRRTRSGLLVIDGTVNGQREIAYCRFVRIDGLGFTLENMPAGYTTGAGLDASGHCVLGIESPSMLDLHPWTVVARIQGQDTEVAGQSGRLVDMPGEQPVRVSSFAFVWVTVILVTLAMFFVGLLLGPKKNRNWTYSRAAHVGDSLRRSFQKSPPLPQKTTVAA